MALEPLEACEGHRVPHLLLCRLGRVRVRVGVRVGVLGLGLGLGFELGVGVELGVRVLLGRLEVVDAHPGALPQEGVHGEAARVLARARGGQHVVGTRAVIAEHLRACKGV